MNTNTIRRAFAPPSTALVRVTAEGFLVNGHHVDSLEGRIVKTRLLRKLFEGAVLACDSLDGIRSRSGQPCESCQHPRCRPQLRIWLAQGSMRFLIDLPAVSAHNCINFLAPAGGEDPEGPLPDGEVRLTVLNHATWGEVCFEPV